MSKLCLVIINEILNIESGVVKNLKSVGTFIEKN